MRTIIILLLLAMNSQSVIAASYEVHAYRSGTYLDGVNYQYTDVILGQIRSRHNGRGFYVFDLRSLDFNDELIVGATLSLELLRYQSPENSIPFGVYDVGLVPGINPPSNTSLSNEIYRDLGSGQLYGQTASLRGQSSQEWLIELGAEAYPDIENHEGQYFALAVSRLTNPDSMGASDAYIQLGPGSNVTYLPNYVPRLTIETVPIPEPASIVLLGTALVVGLSRRRAGRTVGLTCTSS